MGDWQRDREGGGADEVEEVEVETKYEDTQKRKKKYIVVCGHIYRRLAA